MGRTVPLPVTTCPGAAAAPPPTSKQEPHLASLRAPRHTAPQRGRAASDATAQPPAGQQQGGCKRRSGRRRRVGGTGPLAQRPQAPARCAREVAWPANRHPVLPSAVQRHPLICQCYWWWLLLLATLRGSGLGTPGCTAPHLYEQLLHRRAAPNLHLLCCHLFSTVQNLVDGGAAVERVGGVEARGWGVDGVGWAARRGDSRHPCFGSRVPRLVGSGAARGRVHVPGAVSRCMVACRQAGGQGGTM